MLSDQHRAPARVLYIAGAGRSGSTLLDLILGNHREIASVGELAKLPSHGWVRRDYCGCGEPGHLCPFWSEVRRRWLGPGEGAAALAEVLELQGLFERARRWPRLLAEAGDPSPELLRYADLMASLYRAILAVSGRRVVVDSSKNPARAFALALSPGIDLRLLHLVRDPRGMAFSYAKAFAEDRRRGVQEAIAPQPPLKSALAWRLVNRLAARVRAVLPPARSAELRYEDLVGDPVAELGRLGPLVGLDLAPLGRRVAAGEELAIQHPIAGSRLRMMGSFRLRPDVEWQSAMPARQQRLVARLAGLRSGGGA